MAAIVKWWKRLKQTLPGQLILAALYAGMLILVLLCFTGEGQFIYELS